MKLWPGVLAGVALLGLAAWASHCYEQERSAWEARAERVEGYAASQAELAQAEAARADSAAGVADSLRGELVERERAIRARAEEVMGEAVPDTCLPFVEPREEIIRSYMGLDQDWLLALEGERAATTHWRSAYGLVTEANDSLRTVLADRPGPAPWWKPEFGVGLFVGIDTRQRPTAGVGLTLSWRLP